MTWKVAIWTMGAVIAAMVVYKLVVEKYVLKSGFEGYVDGFDSSDFYDSSLKVA